MDQKLLYDVREGIKACWESFCYDLHHAPGKEDVLVFSRLARTSLDVLLARELLAKEPVAD